MKSSKLIIKKPIDVSKELEIINFRVLREVSDGSYLKQDFKSWVTNEINIKSDDVDEYNKQKNQAGKTKHSKKKEKTQFRSFQKTMKGLLIFGQWIGLNPVLNITGNDVSKIRFVMNSWTFTYSILITIMKTIVIALCFNMLFHTPVSIRSLSYVSFYFTTWIGSCIFIRIATKWNILIKEIFNCDLDEYVDQGIIRKVKIFCIATAMLASLEHLLAVLARLVQVYECNTLDIDLYEQLIRHMFPWVFETGAAYSIPLAITLQLTNIISTICWSYSDLLIVCMSSYLTSVLNQINKKILWAADKNYLSPSVWGRLREDYNRATRLVRLFDDVFSGLILVSFASNLFFISLQIFNILANGLHPKQVLADMCPKYPSGPLKGYEYPVYLVYSVMFLFTRFLAVALISASVNVASKIPAPALYRVPSYAYCKEVQRFLDQVHGDFVALSGLDFFYITRDLVLTVAGTIVTYELVLLQFNSEELNKA